MNVFERALEIIDEDGWWLGDPLGPAGERCLSQAWNEAFAELYPWRERWHWHLPGGQTRRWRALMVHRARCDEALAALHAAITQVSGTPGHGCVAKWNDDPGRSEEDVRLALKYAARNLGA